MSHVNGSFEALRNRRPLLHPSPPHIILSAGENNNQWDFKMHQHQKAI